MKTWEPDEDLVILHMVTQGHKWGGIAKELPGRTVASVRNRWQRIEKGRKVREEGSELMKMCLACKKPRRGHICTAKMTGASAPAAVCSDSRCGSTVNNQPSCQALPMDLPASPMVLVPVSVVALGTNAAVSGNAGRGCVIPAAPTAFPEDSLSFSVLMSDFDANAGHPSLLRTNTKFANTVVGGGGKRDPKRFSTKFRASVPGALDDAELESFLMLDPGSNVESMTFVELRKMLTERKFAWVEGGGSACCGFTKSKPKEGSAREHGESEKYNPECGPGEARQGIWRHKDGEVVELHPTPTDVTSKGFASKPSDKTTWRMFRLCVRPTDSMRYPGAFWISGPFWIIPDATLAKMDDAPPTPTPPQLAPGPWRPGQEASAGIIGCGVALSAVGEAEAHVRGTRGRGLELLIGAAAVQTDDDNGSIDCDGNEVNEQPALLVDGLAAAPLGVRHIARAFSDSGGQVAHLTP